MTTKKPVTDRHDMPDVAMIYPETGDQGIKYWCTPDDVLHSWTRRPTKYLRTEPVEKPLKQVRDALDTWDEDFAPAQKGDE